MDENEESKTQDELEQERKEKQEKYNRSQEFMNQIKNHLNRQNIIVPQNILNGTANVNEFIDYVGHLDLNRVPIADYTQICYFMIPILEMNYWQNKIQKGR